MRSVIVADDHPLFLKGLARELESSGIDVRASCSDGEAAIRAVMRHKPDFALLDVRMPVMGGVEAAGRIRAIAPETIIIIISTYDEPAVITEALRAGARAFLPKDSTGGALLDVMKRLLLDPSLIVAPTVRLPVLTRREQEVLQLVLGGQTNREVAACLGIAVDTAKDHVSSLLGKFGVEDRFALYRRASELGLVIPPT